jgi:patatin-like phospholipase/acyl hydrolase
MLRKTRLALVKVLCIDGGGIRGLVPALVLAEIERRTERRIADMVDLVAGTSTGGILACGLARPGPDGRPLFSAASSCRSTRWRLAKSSNPLTSA